MRGEYAGGLGLHATGGRFIPTCVGNTGSTSYYVKVVTVHPHMRGEYTSKGAVGLDLFGSSPRAWGIHAQVLAQKLQCRFIPTCVGNTRTSSPAKREGTVHPHVRGEYGQAGLDPSGHGRFIPTCVGNTVPARPAGGWRPVHPHVRGEYQYEVGSVALEVGSSPRAWGIRGPALAFRRPCRFIPTCVGNTTCNLLCALP